jgi:hypothetical protein
MTQSPKYIFRRANARELISFRARPMMGKRINPRRLDRLRKNEVEAKGLLDSTEAG